MTRHWSLVFAVALAAACHSAAPAPAPVIPPHATPSAVAAPAPQASPTPAAARLPEAFRWVRDSAEHRAIYLQVYRQATKRVEREAARLPAGTWAVVLDADETVIDNLPYEIERIEQQLPFNSASWHEWTEKRAAVPLPGAAAFLARAPARRQDRDRHQPRRERVPGHRGELPCREAPVRRDALQAGRRPERQEPALRGGRARHDPGRAAAALESRSSATTSSTSPG